MRTFSFLTAALLASPLVSAATVQVDEGKWTNLQKQIRDLNKAYKELQQSIPGAKNPIPDEELFLGSNPNPKGNGPLINADAGSTIVPTFETIAQGDGSGQGGPFTGMGGPYPEGSAFNTAQNGEGSCTNANKAKCNGFMDYTQCLQICAASQTFSKQPGGGEKLAEEGKCDPFCVNDCGCDKSRDPIKQAQAGNIPTFKGRPSRRRV
ncbi:MAG: hypothetical protein M1823_001521 [Watsoniomyces obsoletus]|nr:MAG: hypothetical protein M1823_001521 [Watsoniomyces obsoletus]